MALGDFGGCLLGGNCSQLERGEVDSLSSLAYSTLNTLPSFYSIYSFFSVAAGQGRCGKH